MDHLKQVQHSIDLLLQVILPAYTEQGKKKLALGLKFAAHQK